MSEQQRSPIMQVGRYTGVAVDKLPNNYLRWVIRQDFPKIILEAAKRKLEQSDYNDIYLQVSRHAIDMFSKRFLHLWTLELRTKGDEAPGLATFIATCAQRAWEHGTDISKHRHQDDGIVKLYGGIKWVFGINANYPDYKDVITVMEGIEQ